MTDDLDKKIHGLETRVEALRGLLPLAPRAFVIEFAGTPKSGKSTSVEAIRHFFSRHGFRVHVLVERASVCPIPMKGHLFFNTWCASTMLAELIANVDTVTDLIIVDRGLFDALVWLILQRQRGELTVDEAQTIESFLLLERWRTLIDLAVVMNVSPEEAMTRETRDRISSRSGSIMNLEVLSAISEAVVKATKDFGPKFGGVIRVVTSGQTVKGSNVQLVGEILDHLQTFLDPEILVVPRREVEQLPLKQGGAFSENSKSVLLDCISHFGRFMHRAQAEADPDHVQIVACGMLCHNEQVFLFERKERDPKSRLYGKNTIWQGTHVPAVTGKRGIELLKAALVDRITRSLFLSRIFPIDLVGYCWDSDDPNSSRHLGVIFRVDIDNENAATNLHKKEFRRGRGHGLGGQFVSWKTLNSDAIKATLESWSLAILNGRADIRGLRDVV